jgi:predicted ABC-type ATPase
MMPKRFVICLSAAPSCSGKSTLANVIAKKLPDVYTISYDKLKWQLSGYHRNKHKALIKKIALGLFEVVCQAHIPILLDIFLKDAEYRRCYKIAKKYGYEFISVKLIAPKKVLLNRFRERVKRAKRARTKISVTDEKLFIANLSKKSFTPANTLIFDTSLTDADYIADKTIKALIDNS